MRGLRLKNIPLNGFIDSIGNKYFYVCDVEQNYSRWSKNAVEYFGLPSEYMEDAGKIWIDYIHPNDREEYTKDISEIFEGKKSEHCMDYRVKNKHGEYVLCTFTGRIVDGEDGQGPLFVGILENQTIASKYDYVTGLKNVFYFFQESKWCEESNKYFYVMVVGINHFADVNYFYGYEYGNIVLKKYADSIRELVGAKGDVYHMGSTKFCIMLKESDKSDIELIYERLKHIARVGYNIGDNHISFSISGGVVDLDANCICNNSIISSLEYVLEQSKRKKHSELVYFQPVTMKNAQKNLLLMDAIRKSVFNDMEGFYLCYQPIVDVDTEQVNGMEALLRWKKEPFGEVPPGEFIPWLETDPCFCELGNWILKQALLDAKKIVDTNPDFVVNINVSAEQFEREGFSDYVADVLEELHFPGANLCLELTERVMNLDCEYLKGELEYLRSLGIKIALDDFGTGVSSLNLLLQIPVDHLKIDRNFIKDIHNNESEQLIVESISKCAKGMQLDICAEGVENEEMSEFLKKYDINRYQGFYYSKAVGIDEFMELL